MEGKNLEVELETDTSLVRKGTSKAKKGTSKISEQVVTCITKIVRDAALKKKHRKIFDIVKQKK